MATKKEDWKVGRSANGAPTVESENDGMLCIAVFGLHRPFDEAYKNAKIMARAKRMLQELRRIKDDAQGRLESGRGLGDKYDCRSLIKQIDKTIKGLD